ncbi:MAG: 4-hydroxy-tetrahydrodipicolinate synthase [Halieaceae bacterium]|jgi:4-hydroxy-tetrahydrodipicolinate synthase|nr:4-hydroxy-tetrahydrodipicolinate synthase [Halieaceae bacterium]
MTKGRIKGSLVALVTPMRKDGSVDYEVLASLLDWHCEAGTAAIVAVGTTGESATLNVDEHLEVIRSCISPLQGRIALIAGTGANSTKEAIELTAAAAGVGADACLQVTPYYNRPTQRGLFEHFTAIADAVDVPQILYNVPSRTAVDLHNATTLRLAEHPRIVAIKDATGDLARGRELIAAVPEDFAVYSGDDGTAAELILAGASGNISVTANVVPERVAAVCASALAGDVERTHALNGELAALNAALFVEANPMPVKYALERLGRIPRGIRLPMTWPEGEAAAVVDAALAELGLA